MVCTYFEFIKEAYLRIIKISYNRKAWVVRDLRDPLVSPHPPMLGRDVTHYQVAQDFIQHGLVVLNTSSNVGKS